MSSQAVEYRRFHDSETCTEEGCRARRYYIEDGKKFCQRGHEQDGFTQTQQEEDDFIKQGVTTRKKRLVGEHEPIALGGNAAKELYLRCLQLILWKQCYWLINEKGFSQELETIVRDLWTLRVGIVWSDENNGYSSQIETDRGFFSSQSEAVMSQKNSLANIVIKKNTKNDEEMPGLIETLALCYLGMILLRLPISIGEVIDWATRNELLYLRAIKAIPRQMKMKLPARFQAALELKAPFNGFSLHRKILDLVQFFVTHYQIIFPPLNVALLSFKHIRNLGLPVEVYPAIKLLQQILGIDFTFPTTNSNIVHPMYYPEIQLVSLIIIATKLSQPIDSIRRDPESDTDSSLLKLNWEVWSKTMVERDLFGLKRGNEINLTEGDVWNLRDKDIDQYLDWFQQIWMDDQKPKLSERILDLFPLPNVNYQESDEMDLNLLDNRLKDLQSGLIIQKVWPTGSDDTFMRVKRPGEFYKRYRKIEELNKHAEDFYTLAASHIGISLNSLVKAVFKIEIQLDAWVAAERREDHYYKNKIKSTMTN